MTAQPVEKAASDPLKQMLDRLKWAVRDLESAAEDASSAADALEDLHERPLNPDDTYSRDALAQTVREWHDGDSKHDGPFPWCAHVICRTARGA